MSRMIPFFLFLFFCLISVFMSIDWLIYSGAFKCMNISDLSHLKCFVPTGSCTSDLKCGICVGNCICFVMLCYIYTLSYQGVYMIWVRWGKPYYFKTMLHRSLIVWIFTLLVLPYSATTSKPQDREVIVKDPSYIVIPCLGSTIAFTHHQPDHHGRCSTYAPSWQNHLKYWVPVVGDNPLTSQMTGQYLSPPACVTLLVPCKCMCVSGLTSLNHQRHDRERLLAKIIEMGPSLHSTIRYETRKWYKGHL